MPRPLRDPLVGSTIAAFAPFSHIRSMPNALSSGLIVFAVILSGTVAGLIIGRFLPKHHTTEETKRLVSLAMAVVGTVSALVLGLLISSANTAFNARSGEVTRISSDILRLDQMLRLYGSDAAPAREMLRQYAVSKTADLFPEHWQGVAVIDNQSTYAVLQQMESFLLTLHPADDRQRWFMNQALMMAADIGNTRWLLIQRTQQETPKLLLGLVVLWLTLLFASFGLFAERNLTLVVILVLGALAVSGAIEIILELEHPFAGFLRPSPLPMRHAIEMLTQ